MQSATFTAEEDPTGKLAEQYGKPFLGYGEKWSGPQEANCPNGWGCYWPVVT